MSNADVNVQITPASGTSVTALGMFNISISPVKLTDQIINLQYIVSFEGQSPGDFAAFVFIGNLPQGTGLPSSIFYASCDAIKANQSGQFLKVQVVGGINETENQFDVSQKFTENLWPGGVCSSASLGAKQSNELSTPYKK